MSPATITGICFVTMIAAIAPISPARERLSSVAAKVGIVAALYCFGTGLEMLGDWINPLSDAAPGTLGRAAGTAGGKGGVLLLLLAFWPFVLTISAGLFGYVYWLYLEMWPLNKIITDAHKRQLLYRHGQWGFGAVVLALMAGQWVAGSYPSLPDGGSEMACAFSGNPLSGYTDSSCAVRDGFVHIAGLAGGRIPIAIQKTQYDKRERTWAISGVYEIEGSVHPMRVNIHRAGE